MESTKMSLNQLIREAALPGATTQEVADSVLAAMHPDDYPAYIREMLLTRISGTLSTDRASVTPRQISTKQRLIRDEYWPRFLQQKVSLPGGIKTLAEATADDLLFLAQVRRTQAIELSQRADQFEQLANLMNKSRVKFLEDLDSKSANQVLAAA